MKKLQKYSHIIKPHMIKNKFTDQRMNYSLDQLDLLNKNHIHYEPERNKISLNVNTKSRTLNSNNLNLPELRKSLAPSVLPQIYMTNNKNNKNNKNNTNDYSNKNNSKNSNNKSNQESNNCSVSFITKQENLRYRYKLNSVAKSHSLQSFN